MTGEPIKIADTVDYNPPGQAAFAIARSVLVYRPRQHLALGSLMWIDRAGQRAVGDRRVAGGVPATVAVARWARSPPSSGATRRGVSSVWTIDLEAGATVRVPAEYWSGVAGVERRRIDAGLQHRRRLAAEYRRA